MIIGICGGSGSGKTTLLKRLCSHFSELSPSVFSMDNYYRSIENQYKDENQEYNFDLPEWALGTDEPLNLVINGEDVQL